VEAGTANEVDDVDRKNTLIKALASGTGRRVLFMRTKHHAKKLAKVLIEAGIPAVDLHGNLSQPQRDRNLEAFSSGRVKVLVATDVAARGVHVDDIELVIHVDPPMEHKAYLHRSGRTARAGSEGDVVTICLPTQKKDLAALLRKAAITVTPQAVTADSSAVVKLIGEVAEYVKPAPRVAPPQGGREPAGEDGSCCGESTDSEMEEQGDNGDPGPRESENEEKMYDQDPDLVDAFLHNLSKEREHSLLQLEDHKKEEEKSVLFS
jgi:superfamily II DNA/RNA helicase